MLSDNMKIPAIQGRIGDTVYYVTTFTFKQISDLVRRINAELHTSHSINEEIQRSLTENYKDIKRYILTREDRFFDSLVLATYDGNPQWREVRFEIDDESFYNVGILELSGDEKIFPVDGQHRVEGIKAALLEDDSLKDEKVGVMLIGHRNTPEGIRRSRTLFSTLNRYVKPVKLGDIIALDEDDIVAISTREILESFPLFAGNRVKSSNSKSLPTSDKDSFTSLIALYEVHKQIYSAYYCRKYGEDQLSSSKLAKLLKNRPEDSEIEAFISYLKEFWNNMLNGFPVLQDYVDDDGPESASIYRNSENGGNLLFRPISLIALVSAICQLLVKNKSIELSDLLRALQSLEMQINSDLWSNILWDKRSSKMLTNNSSLVKYIIQFKLDNDSLTEKQLKEMNDKFATAKNVDIDEGIIMLNELLAD